MDWIKENTNDFRELTYGELVTMCCQLRDRLAKVSKERDELKEMMERKEKCEN